MRTSGIVRTLWAINGVLAAALAAACYGSYRSLSGGGIEASPVEAWREESKPGVRQGERTLADYAVIWQLDGMVASEPGEGSVDDAGGGGDIRCLGTVVGRTLSGDEVEEYSCALLSDATGERRMVREGDVFGDWVVAGVEKGGALLRRGDEERLLGVQKRVAAGQVEAPSVKVTPVGRPGARGPTVDFSAYVTPSSEVTREVRRSLYGLIMGGGRLYEEVAQSALLKPHSTGGEADGVEVSRIQEGSLASHLGFKSGDVIVGVSGKRISTIEEALRLIPLIMTQSRVDVTLRRGGKDITYYFDLK